MKAIFVVLAVAISGCAGQPADEVAVAEAPSGTIEGVVVDEAVRPIGGANVTLLPERKETRSDAEGRFRIDQILPGVHFVEASAPGHRKGQVQVDVRDDVAVKPKIVLARHQAPAPYHLTSQHTAVHYLTAPGVGALSDARLNVVVDRPFSTVVLEADWSRSQLVLDPVSGAPYYHWLYDDDAEWSHEGHTGTPAYAAYSGEAWPATSDDLYIHTYPENTGVIAMDGRADVFVTLFFNGRAPEGWSVFT